MMSSECEYHQHPRKILKAINDTLDKGNNYGFDMQIFEKDESKQPRPRIEYETYLGEAQQIIKEEIKDYFIKHQPEISWIDFLAKCEQEQ
ncbi:MAG: hypothetical protein KF721_00840 [Ignavibacteriaceae bacterium]|nr:hypothetical protein [Ignavibacteriaceae bacterium]